MDETRYETLLDENTNLKRALSSTKHILERTLNDYETLKQIHEDFKTQYDKVKRENEESNQKYLQLLNDRKDLENQFDNTIRNFKIAIEQKQKELEDVQAKVIPSLDHDMLRIKIINELEGPQRLALENKQQEIDKLQDQVYEFKRQFEILSSKYEASRYEADKEIRDLKDRHKLEVTDLMMEIQSLQERVEDTRDRDVIRNLRRELEELRFRYGDNENEMEEIRREKEKLRDEKNDILIKLNKQIEIEKQEKRQHKAEHDRLVIRVRQLENEISNLSDKAGDKHEAVSRIEKENERLRHDNENKTKQVFALQQQIRDLEDNQVSAQTKLQEFISQTQLQTHEKHISEKSRIAALQREIESYQKTIVELESKHRNANYQTNKDLDMLKQEHTRLNDQFLSNQRSLDSKEEDVSRLKKDIENLQDEIYYLQRKNKELVLQKESASPATRLTHKGTGKDSDLLREALDREEKLKNKNARLKLKLRAANKKIMELLPHKILSQKDANAIYSGVGGSLYTGATTGNLMENIKSKYGIVDSTDVQAPTSDVKYLTAKYGFGIGRSPGREDRSFKYDDVRGLHDKDDGKLQSEIERTADEALKKYGIH